MIGGVGQLSLGEREIVTQRIEWFFIQNLCVVCLRVYGRRLIFAHGPRSVINHPNSPLHKVKLHFGYPEIIIQSRFY